MIQLVLNIFVSFLLLIVYPFFYLYHLYQRKPRKFKNVLITGASRGIGRGLAVEFAKRKVGKLFLLARNLEQLNDVALECSGYGVDVETIVEDVTNRDSMKNTINSCEFDLVIANAGVTLYTGQHDDPIYNLYNVNLFGVLNTVLPSISKMNKGTIAIMSSQAANIPLPNINSFYSSSKAGVSYLSGLKKVKKDVDVVIIQPGYVNTAMTEKIEDFQMLKYFIEDLDLTCKNIVDGLESGENYINYPKAGQYLTFTGHLVPEFMRDTVWNYAPNLILGERVDV